MTSRDAVAAQIESIRTLGRSMADRPMSELETMLRGISQVELSSGAYGAFGLLGTSLGDAFDEVKRAAQRYLLAKRDEASGIHDKAFDSANAYLDADQRGAANVARPR
ncbi:hypothetical protein ACU635_48665 [[Actinomadura] parvosata]|uniref:hypothetical protein n=1 Tax=[Actinomadura] parvosata TaxID=1955412 RepID=UPI00406C06EA